MILSYSNNGHTYNILPEDHKFDQESNIFSVLIGKNGTGKSRLFNSVISRILVDQDIPLFNFTNEYRLGIHNSQYSHINILNIPRKIICVSTNPFDRFPILRQGVFSAYYSYLGLRGLPSQNMSTAYISRIIASLVFAVANNSDKSSVITDVLHYLGYEKFLSCRFTVYVPDKILYILNGSPDLDYAIDILEDSPPSRTQESLNLIRRLKEAKLPDIQSSLDIINSGILGNNDKVDIDISISGISSLDILHLDYILPLIGSGFARLQEVTLKKPSAAKIDTFRLSEASSGEQSVIMALLGIASQIEDFSLVCIDEPETCLHPEWQERYLHLLLETFSGKKGCHFIIATHSPQVIAELPPTNCFVVNMADGTVRESRNLSHRSVDFQLASVFRTPGRQNEFLNRTALNLFSRVAKTKYFSDEDNDSLNFLLGLYEAINPSDPLRELISSLEEMRNNYA